MRRSFERAKHSGGKGLTVALLALVTALVLSTAAGAAVWTDQNDYTPGSVVTISGDNSNAAGYLPGEAVHVAVSGPNDWTATCDAVADVLGAWSCQVTLADGPEAIGEYMYTATGIVSQVTENGDFTDGSFFLRAAAGATYIAVTFPGTAASGSIERFTNSTCSGTPAGWRPTNITTPTNGTFANVTGGILTTAGGSIRATAPATVGSYIFSSWQVVSNGSVATTGTAGCFSGWNALNATQVQANYVLPDPDIEVDKTATAEYFVAGGPVGFQYTVTNEGNVPLSNVGVTDSEYVGPAYQSGDANTNNLLDLTETWIFAGSYTPTFTGPSVILDNVATATGTYGATTVDDKKGFKLISAAVRKAVYLYWQAGGPDKVVDYAAPGVDFTVDIYKRGVGLVGTKTVAEDDPLLLWLTFKPSTATEPGWKFVEQPKTGYPIADARGTIGFDVGPNPGYLDSSFINTIDFGLSVQKTGPVFVGENGVAPFTYEVKNIGPAAVKPVVSDDKCSSPKYMSGDTNKDGLIQPTETWTFRCNETLTWDLGWNFNTGKQLCDTNTATVVDDEFPEDWTGTFYGGDATTPNRDTVSLCALIIRKDVKEFGTGNQLSDTTPFTVTIKQGAKTIGTVTIKEGDPAQFWLQPGTYQFYETVLPFYIPNFETWQQVVGVDYPDWTVVNAKWYGFSHGYYKNAGHRIGWQDLVPSVSVDYEEGTLIGDVFEAGTLAIDGKLISAYTLYQALSFKGGDTTAEKAQILLRQAVAAVLNESRFGSSFGDFTMAELIAVVNAALASGDGSAMTDLAGDLALWNNGYVVAP
jgi:hypothetical protein